MSQKTFKATAVAAGIAMALGTSSISVAQDDEALEEIVVTGSHIRRTSFEGRAPIQIVDNEEIALIGAAQPVEILKQLTVNSGSQFYNETNARAGVSQFNIRNLGLASSLTLLNGKRLGSSPSTDDSGGDFVDINQFPLAMIQRVEVLTDGASATYGSQAVAGVANVITRKGFEGLELSGGYSTAEVDAWHLNLAAGSQFDQGGFNIYGTYYRQGHKERSEFDWMQDRLVGQGDISRSRFLSSTGSPGTYRRANLDATSDEARDVRVPNPDFDPNDMSDDAEPEFLGAGNNPDATCEAAGGVFLNPADLNDGDPNGPTRDTSCRYHFVDQVSVISQEQRAQVFTEFDWNFNETVKYYFEGSFSNNIVYRDAGGATLNTGRAVGGGVTILPDHPFNYYVNTPATSLDPRTNAEEQTQLTYIGPAAWDEAVHGPNAATIRMIGRPLGAEVNNNERTERNRREFNYTRVLNGFEFTLPRDWYLDASHMWARSTLTSDLAHNYRSGIFQDLVRSGEWNPFGTRESDPTLIGRDGVSTAGNDPLTLAKFDQRSVSRSVVQDQVIDVIASGDVIETGFGVTQAAVGAQWRESKVDIVPDSLSAAGEANEEGTSAAVTGEQDVLAFFAEVVIPIYDTASIQLAVRNEDYGGGVSTTDPKFAFDFQPTEWLGFRGSWGTSFQAPTVRQTASAASSAFLDDPASPTGAGGSTVCVSTGLNNNVTVSVEGDPNLTPQESENFSLGAVFQTDRFRASIDYWSFDYTDLIAQEEGAQAIVDNDCENDGSTPSADGIPNDPRVIRDAGGQLRQVLTTFVNVGSVQTDGIDIVADYNMDVGAGQLIFDFGATFINSFDVDTDGDGSVDFDGAGNRNFRNSFQTLPEVRSFLGGTWLTGNHSVNLTARYVDGYKNDQSNNAPVDSWTTFDAQYTYVWPELMGSGDTTLTLGVNNIADEDPPALTRNNDDGTPVTRFNSDGTYNRGWVDRPGYDDRAGHDIRGRIVYFRFVQSF